MATAGRSELVIEELGLATWRYSIQTLMVYFWLQYPFSAL